jgi:hypothetical protein
MPSAPAARALRATTAQVGNRNATGPALGRGSMDWRNRTAPREGPGNRPRVAHRSPPARCSATPLAALASGWAANFRLDERKRLSTRACAKHPRTDGAARSYKRLPPLVQHRSHHRKVLPAAHRARVLGAQARLRHPMPARARLRPLPDAARRPQDAPQARRAGDRCPGPLRPSSGRGLARRTRGSRSHAVVPTPRARTGPATPHQSCSTSKLPTSRAEPCNRPT